MAIVSASAIPVGRAAMQMTGPQWAVQSAVTGDETQEDAVERTDEMDAFRAGLTSRSCIRPRLSATARVRLSQKASWWSWIRRWWPGGEWKGGGFSQVLHALAVRS